MAVNHNHEMKITDLSDDLKLVVMKWLPNEDRLNFVDIFPTLASQIKTFEVDWESDTHRWDQLVPVRGQPDNLEDHGKTVMRAVKLLKMVKNVKCVKLPTSMDLQNVSFLDLDSKYKPFFEVLFFGFLTKLENFIIPDNSTTNYKRRCEGLILNYMIKLHREDSNYDGSGMKYTFQILDSLLMGQIVNYYINLKLNLHVDGSSIHHMVNLNSPLEAVKSMDINIDMLDELITHEIVFESVSHLQMDQPPTVGAFLLGIISFPNVKQLEIKLNYGNLCLDIISHILTLQKLESLKVELTSRPRESLLNVYKLLLTTETPSLTCLKIECNGLWDDAYISNLRRGFKSIHIRNVVDGIIFEFKIDKHSLFIVNCEPSLKDMIEMFPHIRKIDAKSTFMTTTMRLMKNIQEIKNNRKIAISLSGAGETIFGFVSYISSFFQ